LGLGRTDHAWTVGVKEHPLPPIAVIAVTTNPAGEWSLPLAGGSVQVRVFGQDASPVAALTFWWVIS
jgi:hypothetical protein